MCSAVTRWDQKDWQTYANKLLSTHYSLLGHSYQRIPDMVGGDHGLEGISDCGDAYQCYADQDSMTTEERTRKQKAKIREDLAKLETYCAFWSDFLDGRTIRSWTIMVPDVRDKEVVRYAKARARELKKKGLPFIGNDFDAFVKTQDDFPRAQVFLDIVQLPASNCATPTAADVDALKSSKPQFVINIDRKLGKAMATRGDAARRQQRETMLQWHLSASNVLDDLRKNYPAHWEKLDKLLRTTGTCVATEGHFDDRPPNKRLTDTRKELADDLKINASFLASSDRSTLSWGAISEWLGDCTLDFA
jgi:hypothetical protein